MDDQKPSGNEEDFMDFKDPFFEELDKIKSASDQNLGPTAQQASKESEESTPPSSTNELRVLLERIAADSTRALSLLNGKRAPSPLPQQSPVSPRQDPLSIINTSLPQPVETVGTVIEGVFDGTGMIGNDGKHYSMPPNYASKSKLVEGDTLKLTISPEGSFIYKQIHPIERKRVMGLLVHDPIARQYTVAAEGKIWKVLTASVTYFKGITGDEAVILVPQDRDSAWAAVEHIIKKYT